MKSPHLMVMSQLLAVYGTIARILWFVETFDHVHPCREIDDATLAGRTVFFPNRHVPPPYCSVNNIIRNAATSKGS